MYIYKHILYIIASVQKIIPCLWFDDKAEEAKFYASIFKNSKIGDVTYCGKEGYEIHGREEGSVLTVDFEIEGQKFVALNGGPVFKFNEAISFQIHCETQEEVDYYWKYRLYSKVFILSRSCFEDRARLFYRQGLQGQGSDN